MGDKFYTPSPTRVRASTFKSARGAYTETSNPSKMPKVNMSHIRSGPDAANFVKDRILKTGSPSPLVWILDDTGSMGKWVDIIYNKLPMFYGQIMLHGYLPKPEVSFCLVGDANGDRAPLQATDFADGKTLDQKIETLWIERKGGDGYRESYELAAYYYLNRCELTAAVKPFLFFTGDETFYPFVGKAFARDLMGIQLQEKIDSMQVLRDLTRKFECFILRKQYGDSSVETEIHHSWVQAFGEPRVIMLNDPNAVIDIALGAISLTVGRDNLLTYSRTLEEREQTKKRIRDVNSALKALEAHSQRMLGPGGDDFGKGHRSRRKED